MLLINRMKKSLLFRFIAPLILFWTLAGILFFVCVGDSIADFRNIMIEKKLQDLSHEAYSICTEQLFKQMQGYTSTPTAESSSTQKQTLTILEKFFKKNNTTGIVSQKKIEGYTPILTMHLHEPNHLIPSSALNNQQLVTFSIGVTTYYSFTSPFTPWNWRITIIRHESQFPEINRQILIFAAVIFIIIAITALLLISIGERLIRQPIQRIITNIQNGEKPSYSGIDEIEFLSSSICEMMTTLEDQGRTLEAKVANRTHDLASKAKELEHANARLTELDTLKSVFMSSISHELRTPLTSILGFAKVSDKTFKKHFGPLFDNDPELSKRAQVITDNLSIIHQEGERLRRLINNILDLSRIESGQLIWKPSLFSIRDAILESIESARIFFADKPIQLKSTVADILPYLYMDRERFMQVLRNLIENAAKFTTEGEVELIAHESAPGVVRVQVKDTGTGIAPEELSKVFNMFHQTMDDRNVTSGKPTGFGLGLSICKQIIEHYGGVIWVESTPEKGSIFTFELQTAGRSQVPSPKRP